MILSNFEAWESNQFKRVTDEIETQILIKVENYKRLLQKLSISVPPRHEKVDKLIFLFSQSTDIQFNMCLHGNHLDPLPHITKVAIQLDWSQLSFHNSAMVQNHVCFVRV